MPWLQAPSAATVSLLSPGPRSSDWGLFPSDATLLWTKTTCPCWWSSCLNSRASQLLPRVNETLQTVAPGGETAHHCVSAASSSSCLAVLSHPVMSDSLETYECRLWPAKLLCPYDSPQNKIGVGWAALLQGSLLPTQDRMQVSSISGGIFII